jgi:two-component sensor histidine kinase
VQAPGGQIVGFSAIVRDIRERIQHQEQMQTVMHELSHRAKNVMAVISAIANQMGRNCETIEQFQARFNDRIRAFAASHDALVERNWSGVPMYELVPRHRGFDWFGGHFQDG